MDLRNAALGDSPMLVVTGDVDRETCGLLRAALEKTLRAGHNIIFLDFTNVASVDNAGLSVLESAGATLRTGWLGLIGPGDELRRLLESRGLLSQPSLRIFADRQAALAVTGERAST